MENLIRLAGLEPDTGYLAGFEPGFQLTAPTMARPGRACGLKI